MSKKKIEIGDEIIFKSATRASYRKAKRKVNGFWFSDGAPTVRYEGWSDFRVSPHEIIEIIKAK